MCIYVFMCFIYVFICFIYVFISYIYAFIDFSIKNKLKLYWKTIGLCLKIPEQEQVLENLSRLSVCPDCQGLSVCLFLVLLKVVRIISDDVGGGSDTYFCA